MFGLDIVVISECDIGVDFVRVDVEIVSVNYYPGTRILGPVRAVSRIPEFYTVSGIVVERNPVPGAVVLGFTMETGTRGVFAGGSIDRA